MGGAISLAQAIQELKGDFQRIVSTKGGAPCGSEPPCPTGAELRARLRLMSKHQRRGCVGMEEVGRRGPGGREGTGAAAATSWGRGMETAGEVRDLSITVYCVFSRKISMSTCDVVVADVDWN